MADLNGYLVILASREYGIYPCQSLKNIRSQSSDLKTKGCLAMLEPLGKTSHSSCVFFPSFEVHKPSVLTPSQHQRNLFVWAIPSFSSSYTVLPYINGIFKPQTQTKQAVKTLQPYDLRLNFNQCAL